MAEQKRRRHNTITTLSGNVTTGHPVEAIGRGQAVIVVAGNKVYNMAGLWDNMNKEEAGKANNAGFAGKQ